MKDKIVYLFFTFALLATIQLTSCNPESEEFAPSVSTAISFSSDTVSFDTLITNQLSVTHRLKIYNSNKSATLIKKIGMRSMEQTPYEVIINGIPSHTLENQKLFGNDSLMVLFSVTIPESEDSYPFKVEDFLDIEFDSFSRSIPVLAWGENTNQIEGQSHITENTTWDDSKPYMLNDTLWIDQGATLSIASGVKIYGNDNTAIIVNGSLEAIGTYESPIQFTSWRQDDRYEDMFGQWGGIYFSENSKNNKFENVKIRNAQNGIISDDNSDISLHNTVIENMTYNGVMNTNGVINASNTVINNCGDYCIKSTGGTIDLKHSTLANFYYNLLVPGRNTHNALVLIEDQSIQEDGTTSNYTVKLNLENNIIACSSWQESIILNFINEGHETNIINNLINSRDEEMLNGNHASDFSMESLFTTPEEYNYTLNAEIEDHPATNKGNDIGIPVDLANINREYPCSLGAFEFLLTEK
ncbi:hypothetical protein [Aureibacter tunicatorum]|uniref:Right handed beta helix domain-containing protein n=1 Tax=Aureibacter tunicatorum TaxID=866807 RepID=A0AAE4BQV7_9BACT|nr:hypothetical protein [Aureibacter tunicatorum]MDR6237313.1 hypothetical protein [Aureibacter tunicatorum]BDD06304.1 hypothetical protein AUTU_37870 [Aureibacter tunicatorum]